MAASGFPENPMADKKIELRCHLYTRPSATAGMPVVESPDEGVPAGSVVSMPADQADRLIKLGLAKEVGEAAEVFASANMEHPQALARANRAGPVVLFARNELCALVRPDLAATSETLLERLLDPRVKLGTSTPRADPSGDYAFAVFARASFTDDR